MSIYRFNLTILFLVLFLPSSLVQAQIDGTLFTTQEQRDYLDALREEQLRRNPSKGFNFTEANLPDLTDSPENTTPQYFSLKGVMRLKDESYRVWLNDTSLNSNQLPPLMSLLQEKGQMVLSVNDDRGNRYNIKIGQTLELNSGTITNTLEKLDIPPETSAETSIATELPDSEAGQINEESTDATVEPPSIINSLLDNPKQMQQLLEVLQTQGIQGNENN